MSIDSGTDAGSDTSTASEDSASLQTFPTSVETPAMDLGQAPSKDDAGVIAEDGSIKVDSRAADQESLKTPDTASQTTDKSATPAAAPQQRDWLAEIAMYEKRLKDQQAGYTRAQQHAKQLEQQYQGVDPAAVRAFQESQRKAEQAKLPVWNKQNPAHAGFTKTLDKWQTYKSAIAAAQKPRQGETPEQAQINGANRAAIIKESYGSTFSSDEANSIAAWEQHQQDFNRDLAMDTRGTIESIARDIARQEFQQQAMVSQADREVGGWFQDPKNADIIAKFGPNMKKALDDGVPWEYAKVLAIQGAELGRLQSRTGENQKTADQAKAQQSLLRGKATVTRDGAAQPIKDPAAEALRIAKQRGWRADDPRMMGLIHQLSSKT